MRILRQLATSSRQFFSFILSWEAPLRVCQDTLAEAQLLLRLMCWRGCYMYSLLSGVLLEILVDKLSPLVAQSAQHLGTMKGLELLTGGNVVNHLCPVLFSTGMKNGNNTTLSSCWTRRPATTKYLLLSKLRSPQ